MKDQELANASILVDKPMVMHFAVCPHSPSSGVLLNEQGIPVLTDYSTVDWKGLAETAQEAIEGFVPKNIKVYVSDDAVDVMDVLGLSTDTGMPLKGIHPFDKRLRTAFNQVTMADMRSGATKIAGRHPGLHANTPIEGKRPPVGALVLSVKFATGYQLYDYWCSVTDRLFGKAAPSPYQDGNNPGQSVGEMPQFWGLWLRSQFGVVYGAEGTVFSLARTFTDLSKNHS